MPPEYCLNGTIIDMNSIKYENSSNQLTIQNAN